MGYRRPKTVYKLTFEDPNLSGLEVRATALPVGKMLKLGNLAALRSRTPTGEDLDRVHELFETFAAHIVSWNLEDDDDKPVPVTVAAVLDLEIDFALDLALAWLDAVVDVPAPLVQRSNGGGSSLEGSLTMVPSSPSLTS